MSKVTHIAIKTNDLEKSREFYQRLFHFEHTGTNRVRDHMALHLQDGALDITFTQYDEPAPSPTGAGGPFDHLGLEVEDVEQFVPLLAEFGAPVLEKTAGGRIKFRDPNGLIVELIPKKKS
jgi:catechol 2,3-dioxygenase-like lactoylglutathione lyase family enzyme